MYKKIFCPIDGSEISNRGMDEAIRLAKDQQAELCFLHVVDNGPLMMYPPVVEGLFETVRARGREILENAVHAARAQGVTAQAKMAEIVAGRVSPLIIDEAVAYQADIIVMGTHGRRGVNRLLLGSDAGVVIAGTRMPVLLVK